MNLAYKKILGKFTKVLGFGKTPPYHVGKHSQIISFFFWERTLLKDSSNLFDILAQALVVLFLSGSPVTPKRNRRRSQLTSEMIRFFSSGPFSFGSLVWTIERQTGQQRKQMISKSSFLTQRLEQGCHAVYLQIYWTLQIFELFKVFNQWNSSRVT